MATLERDGKVLGDRTAVISTDVNQLVAGSREHARDDSLLSRLPYLAARQKFTERYILIELVKGFSVHLGEKTEIQALEDAIKTIRSAERGRKGASSRQAAPDEELD